eukprot:581001-Pleurochrysis_carterae.AAC.1
MVRTSLLAQRSISGSATLSLSCSQPDSESVEAPPHSSGGVLHCWLQPHFWLSLARQLPGRAGGSLSNGIGSTSPPLSADDFLRPWFNDFEVDKMRFSADELEQTVTLSPYVNEAALVTLQARRTKRRDAPHSPTNFLTLLKHLSEHS